MDTKTLHREVENMAKAVFTFCEKYEFGLPSLTEKELFLMKSSAIMEVAYQLKERESKRGQKHEP
jgi:hypothetical protein